MHFMPDMFAVAIAILYERNFVTGEKVKVGRVSLRPRWLHCIFKAHIAPVPESGGKRHRYRR